MINGNISVIRGTDRYITIAVDECDGCNIKGVMFHWDDPQGIQYSSMMEMILNMDYVFDSMSCPKQTFQMRRFPGTNPSDFVTKTNGEKVRDGKLSTFRIYMQYRYHASWQGVIHWEEGNLQAPFESMLQLILTMDQMLKRDPRAGQEGEVFNSFHVAIDDYDSGRITGNYQNVSAGLTEQHDIPADLAETLGNFMEIRVLKEGISKYELDYGRLLFNEIYSMCRRVGQKATFSIKIMFREHSTWQGIIYWREGKVEQPFRSFKEMLYLIVSVVGEIPAIDESYEEGMPPIALGS